MSGDTKAPGTAPKISSFRLLGTMGGAGALAGLLIVLVYQFTLPTVLANRAARLETAIHQVLPGIERYDTLYFHNRALVRELPPGVDARKVEKVYAGVAGGRERGYAIPASQAGFQDAIDVIFGFDPAGRATLGLVILSSRETPGLGDKIEAPKWLEQFAGAQTPLSAVKAGQSERPEDVEMITGATISSRTVIGAINKAVERWAPIIEAYRAGGKP
ncbi:MAG TPA: RnfABCDGE type electron transport complex subunit G [Vicinamibacterales bacterium]|nr:RnfABCDGE type electron transport complex subunit G [Vicinamibacterales bacterium]